MAFSLGHPRSSERRALIDDEPFDVLALATVLRDPLGILRGPPEQAVMERTADRARARLGEAEFASIFDPTGELEPATAMAEAARSRLG